VGVSSTLNLIARCFLIAFLLMPARAVPLSLDIASLIISRNDSFPSVLGLEDLDLGAVIFLVVEEAGFFEAEDGFFEGELLPLDEGLDFDNGLPLDAGLLAGGALDCSAVRTSGSMTEPFRVGEGTTDMFKC